MTAREQHKKAFTLIELLGVLTVMAIVMAITIPAFTGILGGRKMDAAINQLRNTLSLARQHAILHGSRVAVVIPDPASLPSYSAEEVDKCLSAYAVYDLTLTNYITEWFYLPDGIVFDVSATRVKAPSGIGTYSNFFEYGTSISVPFPDSSSSVDGDFIQMDFHSDGTCSKTTPVVIFLTEGRALWPAGGALSATPPQYIKTPDGMTNALIVYSRGGRFEVVRDE
jgi:prepilin-type N-terminal cleavage/methylation domain-containing protein